MKNKKLIILISMTLIMVVAIAGTLAWLTDRDSVKNTFTVGDVQIELDEAVVDEDGNPLDNSNQPVDKVEDAARTEVGNNYHLIPGQTYVKDPTVTVIANSEESYVRMIVKVNKVAELDAVFAAHKDSGEVTLDKIFGGYDEDIWVYEGSEIVTEEVEGKDVEKRVYEFRYKETVTTMGSEEDKELPALFETITVPGVISGEEMKTLAELAIEVEGHAIQVATFENDVEGAWAAFDAQYK